MGCTLLKARRDCNLRASGVQKFLYSLFALVLHIASSQCRLFRSWLDYNFMQEIPPALRGVPWGSGSPLTLSKLGSASPSFIHLCLQICSIERRLLGSNTSMWRIKCSHSATDKEPSVSMRQAPVGPLVRRQTRRLASSSLLISLSCSLLLTYVITYSRRNWAKAERAGDEKFQSGGLVNTFAKSLISKRLGIVHGFQLFILWMVPLHTIMKSWMSSKETQYLINY